MGGNQHPTKTESSTNADISSGTRVPEQETVDISSATCVAEKENDQVRTCAPMWRAFDTYADDPRCEDITLENVVTGSFSPRDQVDEAYIKRLGESLRTDGQQRAIIVTPRKGKLAVISGESRVLAARKVGLTKLRGLNIHLTDEQGLAIALAANLDHALPHMKLTEMEEAKRLDTLIKHYSWTQDKAADYLGKSRRWVGYRLDLLKVEEPVKQHVEKGELTPSHARSVSSLPPEAQSKVADVAASEKLSVRETDQLARAVREAPQSKAASAEQIDEIIEKNVEALKTAPRKPANQWVKESGAVQISVSNGVILFSCPCCHSKLVVNPEKQIAVLDNS